jgi:hypothetical protein
MFVRGRPLQPSLMLEGRVRPDPSRLKHTFGALLLDRLLALTANIRLGWKGQSSAITLVS